MDRFQDIGGNIGSDKIIMTLMWVMVTGALIWVMDNFLKRFENTMEDGFRKQARNINDSFRINVTLLLMSLSVFAYYRYYLKADTSQLTSLMDSLIELLYSVGHFILYLLAYIVYLGYSAIDADYSPGRPKPDGYVFLGLIVMFSYIVVKRLFFRKVPPLLWAVIVAGVMVGFNFVAKQYNINPKELIGDRFPRSNDEETEVTDDEETVPFSPTTDENTPTPTPPEEEKEEEEERVIPTAYDADDIFIFKDKLLTAIENFDRLVQRTEPDEDNYLDNQTAYIDAVNLHIAELKQTDLHKELEELVTDFKKKGLFQYREMHEVLEDNLCQYYYAYFDQLTCKPRAR